MEQAPQPRVLLGNLEPIMAVGLRRVLAEDGIQVIGQEQHPRGIVTAAGRLRPDVVVLDLNDSGGRTLGDEVRRVSPDTKVILWARDESVMEVFDPMSDHSRLIAVTVPEGLRMELSSSRPRPRVEE